MDSPETIERSHVAKPARSSAPDGIRLLTGATDGIGLALARRWLARGERAFLHGRRGIAEVAGIDPALFDPSRYLQADLARPEGPARLADAFRERAGESGERLDLLVLNAATGWFGDPAQEPPERTREIVAVNLWAPIELCHRLLPCLRRARGRIALVSSVVSSLPVPHFTTYTAAKAALEGFARSLRSELAGAVEVQVLRPGATRTGIHAKAGAPADLVGTRTMPSAETVAALLDRELGGSPRWRTLGARNRLLFAAGRALPALAERGAARVSP